MGTLNPNLLSPELNKAMNAAATRMRALNRPVLTPALLLQTFARDTGSAAHRLLTALAVERSFRMDELAASAEPARSATSGRRLHLTDERGGGPLSGALIAPTRRAARPGHGDANRHGPRWAGWRSAAGTASILRATASREMSNRLATPVHQAVWGRTVEGWGRGGAGLRQKT
jgi:hypothetical protein